MLFRIFLFHRRGKKIVLCIVVDHGLCQDLVLVVPAGGAELALHKCCDLVHIEINIWNILRFHVVNP